MYDSEDGSQRTRVGLMAFLIMASLTGVGIAVVALSVAGDRKTVASKPAKVMAPGPAEFRETARRPFEPPAAANRPEPRQPERRKAITRAEPKPEAATDAPPAPPPSSGTTPGPNIPGADWPGPDKLEPRKPEPRKPEPFKYPPLQPGKVVYSDYHLNKIQGFSVYINKFVFEENQRADGRPLDCLQDELDRICVVAPRLLKAMRTVKIFVEWDHIAPGLKDSIAVFYGGGGEWLTGRGVTPLKAGSITILSLKRVTEIKSRGLAPRKAVVILHEMAHAAHHFDLKDDNPFIRNAYEQAMTRGLYRSVPDDLRGNARAYAATNAHEYFAELTCAYLDYCDYYPHDREELREYDSVGYELMRKVWGEPARLSPKKTSHPN